MENNENLRFFMDESSAPYDEHMLTNEDTELIEELIKCSGAEINEFCPEHFLLHIIDI